MRYMKSGNGAVRCPHCGKDGLLSSTAQAARDSSNRREGTYQDLPGEAAGVIMSGMTEFATVYGYLNFERSVKQKARYIHDEQTRTFLRTVMETSESRRKTLQRDQILWRAQRGLERRIIKLNKAKRRRSRNRASIPR